ncbi:MAG: hypothetical protein K0Q99_1916 [Clostridia bacterium]|nr:hypothetical protein [Clostridia bacterium]
MKKGKSQFKRFLSALLTVSIIFSLFAGVIVVEAASISTVLYQRITENTSTGPKFRDVLTIRGMDFVQPEVYVGEFSDIRIPINASLSSKSEIIIDDQDQLKNMAGKIHNIKVYNNGTDLVNPQVAFDLTAIPTITSISKSKVYSGDPFNIEGLFEDKLDTDTDKLFVAGTEYTFGSDAAVDGDDENKINIASAKAPNTTGIGDVVIERKIDALGMYRIESILKNSVTVRGRLTGIEIERVDPNTGPRNIKNAVKIYGTATGSNFNDNMRVFVNGSEGVNKGTIIDGAGKVIGLSVELPTSATSGTANIILTNSIANSEFEIVNGFIYQDIGNTLTIDTDGISPNFQKETEDVAVTITGRNIGYFDGTNYDKLTSVVPAAAPLIKYAPYGAYPQFSDNTTYKVKYTGVYNGLPVSIIRQISVFVDGDAKIDTEVGTPDPTFTKSKDTIIVDPADVNLDPNQPKFVDVKIKTTTTVFAEPAGTIYYARNEEYTVKNGFKYIPDEIAPEITSLTPEYGPSDKEIYMTIMGKDFQVLPDGTTPTVIIGDRKIEGKTDDVNNVKVYDSQNREVDGKIITLGTKIKIKLPAGAADISGAVDLTVINPSKGLFTKVNAFEYRDPNRVPLKMPDIMCL